MCKRYKLIISSSIFGRERWEWVTKILVLQKLIWNTKIYFKRIFGHEAEIMTIVIVLLTWV